MPRSEPDRFRALMLISCAEHSHYWIDIREKRYAALIVRLRLIKSRSTKMVTEFSISGVVVFGKSSASQEIVDQDASVTHKRALSVRVDTPRDHRTKYQQCYDERHNREIAEIEARWRDERRRVSEARNTPPASHPNKPRDRGERMSLDDVVSAGMIEPFTGSGSRVPWGSYATAFLVALVVIAVLFH